MNNLQVVDNREVLGFDFKVYGDFESPLFLAKDVATWIEHSNVTDMISRVDEEEVTKLNLGGKQGECNFLTEDGLYEVLMQSRKPIAKEFKKKVKEILKELRKGNSMVVPTNGQNDLFVQMMSAVSQVLSQNMDSFKNEIKRDMLDTRNIITEQEIKHEQELNRTKELICLRTKNTSSLTKLLKAKISAIKGHSVKASDYHYMIAKERIFRHLEVWTWESIQVSKYDEVHSLIDTIDSLEDVFDI